MSFTDFFQPQQAPPPQHVPEPAGFDLIRDLLMRKAFGLQADPYTGASPAGFSTGLMNAPAFPGGGNTPGYPTSTTSGPGGSGGYGARQTRTLTRPVGPPPGSRVPINAGGSPSSSGLMSGMAGGSLQPTGGSGDIGSLLAAMLGGGTQGRSFDAHNGSGMGHNDPQAQIAAAIAAGNWGLVSQLAAAHPHDNSNVGTIGSTGSYTDFEGQKRWAQPGMAGRMGQFGSNHTFGGYNTAGQIAPLLGQNSQQGAAGQNFGRPNDPAASSVYDRLMARQGGHGPVGFGGNFAPQPPPGAPPPGSGNGTLPPRPNPQPRGRMQTAPLPPRTTGPRPPITNPVR